MKNKETIMIIKNISKDYNSPAEKRAFDKAIAALEYCDKNNLTYYTEEKYFGKLEDE